MRVRSFVLALTLLLGAATAFADEALTRLLRFPDIEGELIAFVYAGDIWVVDAKGGVARRLTSHEGMELFPKFSPDGRSIAFTGEYSGTRQVHVISVDGGTPRQLTFYNDVGVMPPRGGFDNVVLGWTPDGKNVLFRANRLPWGERMGRPFVVPIAGGMETPLEVPESGSGSLSPDGTKFVYTPIEREFRTWKRYRGGRAQDVWIYDLANHASEKITDWVGTDNLPQWVGDTIYFASDREHTLNLYGYDTKTKQTRKLTSHGDYDVLWPSGGSNALVYECGGYVYRFDPAKGVSTRVPIRVYGDFEATLPYFKNVSSDIESFEISPSGARAILVARGDVFTVPAKDGNIRNLTRSSGVRERDASWSPDGKWIAYLSDKTGEYEIFVRSADGSGDERRVTTDGSVWRFEPRWSPDGTKLAYADKDLRLRITDVATGRTIDVDRGGYGDITHYRWSPDSRWLTFSKDIETRLSAIFVYELGSARLTRLTSGMTNDREPVFDPKGRYLYFLSDRDFNLNFSSYEFVYHYTDSTRVYLALLTPTTLAPLLPKSDEESPAAAETKKNELKKDEPKKGEASAKPTPPAVAVSIEAAGFESRVRAVPGSAGSYSQLAATADGPIYLVGDDGAKRLALYNLEQRKEETVIDGINGYALSAQGEKLAYRRGSEYGIAEAKGSQSGTKLNLERLEMKIVPHEEWAQIFDDGWRLLRDWFYDPKMHGLDWNRMRERYGALVPHVAHRADLDFIFGELGGELNAGHVYVDWGDFPRPKRREGGLLGAEVVADPSGYFRVVKIFAGENWHEAFRSPLTEPGVRVQEGEFILAVDGFPTKGVENFYQLLENKGGQVVTLLVNGKPEPLGAHSEKVRTITRETNLRYLDWVRGRREMVEKASGGRIGYIHLPNTAVEGNRELFKHFYPQAGKEALIIDDRYNGGGFIPDRMIELLDRPVLSYWARRGVQPSQTPGFAHQGPKVLLMNGYSSSGGDAFPYYFRKRGLGKLIGTRTWGGLIGLSGNPAFVDGGGLNVPEFRFFDTEGMWAVENRGVEPDIEVVDRPELVAKGEDPSLAKALEVLLDELAKGPRKPVTIPAPPDESK
ncbi:MAG: PD40 domain-containing protein [Acidobacteria bacterium]|nr:PD40 domain-containing protein [Acidobacteriota bacterium]